jgi:hypothetical protein
MPKATSFIKIGILLFGVLMLSGMSGCPHESGAERGGEGSDMGGGSDTGGGSGY